MMTEPTSPIPDWTALQAQGSLERRAAEVEAQVDAILKKFETLNLTECFLNRERGGQSFIVALDRRNKNRDQYKGAKSLGRWRLRMLVDAQGKQPKPGDEWFYQTGIKTTFIDADGSRKPMNTTQQSLMMKRTRKRGDLNDPYTWDEYVLDKDCCIECDFFQAMAILTNYSELSIYPEKDGGDAFNEPERFYWLFDEVPLDYTTTKDAGKTRG